MTLSWVLVSLQNMVEYFKKLDIALPNLDFNDMNSGEVLHNPRGLDFTYYKIKEEYIPSLTLTLPVEYRDKVSLIVYVIVGGPYVFLPHRDKAGKTAINYYIKTGPSETSFYEAKTENPGYVIIDGEECEGWFDYDDITKVASFQANTNDCYKLSIGSMHDLKLHTEEKRHFIQFIFEEEL